MSSQALVLLRTALFAALLAACGSPPSPTPTALFVLPTHVLIPPPTEVIAPSLTTPPPPLPSPVRASTSTPTVETATLRIKIFLVALDDNGRSGKKIGCNDSIIGVERPILATQAVLHAALTELFSVRDRTYGQSGLYNALYQSTLKVEGINLVSGKATIRISGKVVLGGVCDTPRFKAQIDETALQFSTVTQTQVFLNNIPINEALSEK